MFLLRFILFFILFYLLVKFIGRLLFGYTRRNSRHFYAHNGEHERNRKEGDVQVDNNSGKKNKIIRKEEGEYINYEEIKD